MPLRVKSTRRRLSKRTVRRPRRVMRVKRAPKSYSGFLKIKRSSNLADCAGLTVDTVVVTKTSNNVLFQSGAVAGTLYYGAMVFKAMLSDVTAYTEFTNLYDTFTVVGVRLKITPYGTAAMTAGAVAATQGQPSVICHSCIDLDDATIPTASEAGITEIRQYPSYRQTNLHRTGKGIKVYFRPKIAQAAYANTVFTAYKQSPWGWTDCNSPAIEGYGWKAIWESVGSGGTVNMYFKGEVTYYLKFKDPR